MAEGIVATDESAGAFAGAADEQAEFDVIDYGQTESFVATAFAVNGRANEVECAHAEKEFGFVAINARKPVGHGEKKGDVP